MSDPLEPQESYARKSLEEIWEALRTGDEGAWSEFHRRYRSWMQHSIRQRLGRNSRRRFDTEDVLQSSFLGALKGAESFELRDEKALLAWLRTIITHTYFDMRRQEATRSARPKEEPTESLDGSPLRIDERPSRPSEIFSRIENQERVMSALGRLDDEDHRIITLRDLEGLPWPEVCKAMGCSEPTARKRHREAFQRLNRAM